MKRIKSFFTLLAVALISTLGSHAIAAESATLQAAISSFNEIHISGGYEAQLIPGNEFSYKVTWDAEYINDVEISVEGNKFKASIKTLKKKASFSNHPVLVVTYPDNHSFGAFKVHLTAGAKLDVKDFSSDEMEIKALAGSDFIANSLSTKNGEVDLNAGSKFGVEKVTAENFDIRLTSGSDMSIGGIETKSLKIKGNSGSDGTIAGKAETADIDLSSAARINGKDFNAASVELEASSGASIRMGIVENQIIAKSTTGASISYNGNPAVNNVKYNTGGSINKL